MKIGSTPVKVRRHPNGSYGVYSRLNVLLETFEFNDIKNAVSFAIRHAALCPNAIQQITFEN